jgi:carbon storage regulator
MLVLTRKIQESVVVGGADHFKPILKVKVLEIRGEKVKLGFDVDADVPVHRLEVWERVFGTDRLNSSNDDAAIPIK